MNSAANEYDVGPLTWIRSEVDQALERADQALQQYAMSAGAESGAGDLTQIKFCRTHLHQVQGALTIVELDGVTQFADAVEQLLQAIEQGRRPAGPAAIGLVERALAAIGHYLDDLINGQPNQPLRLLSLYREVQAARGASDATAADLFFPDLSLRPPRRSAPAKLITQGELQKLLRRERARFEHGFLVWLRDAGNKEGVGEMLHAVKRIEETQDAPGARAFWWIAGAFLGAVVEGALSDEKGIKRLCVRIDLQIRRLIEGSKNVAERLLRDALYQVAQAEGDSAAITLVKETYRLGALIPSGDTSAPAPKEAIRRKLRDIVAATEEAWNKYCAGTVQSFAVFRENAAALTAIVEQLGQTDYRRLAQAIAAAANWLGEDSSRHSEALAMEIATAILLAQNAQENFSRLGSDFAHQVDVTVARIHGCIAGTPPQPESEVPLLDEMSRRAQEKLLIGQVAKEIQTNLVQIEQVLDGFFRDPSKHADLATLAAPLRQVAGALAIMRHDGAVAAIDECSDEIKRFADPGYVPQEGDFERVANRLSILGFFVDSLPHGVADFERFVRQMQPAEAAVEDAPEVSVEQEVEQQKLQTHALLNALKDKPDDAVLREEVKQNLVALQNDADLVADAALGEQAKAMLSALGSGAESVPAPQIDAALASLKPQAAEALQPSAETIQLAQASSEEIDAELLEIFLEEANEVLATISESLEQLKGEAHNAELLTTIRRSFHTLKGSGRMVGLKDLGEAAWAVEQTLNLWLRQEYPVGEPLFKLIEMAHGVFSSWVVHLESRSATQPDASPMIALAEALRNGGEEDAPAAAPPVAESVATTVGETPAAESAEAAPPAAPPLEEPRAAQDAGAPLAPAPAEPSVTVISPVLFEIFSEEARVHLQTLQREMPLLEADENAATPHEMYRAAHTLAGISATIGIRPVNQLGSALERALLRRDHSAQPGSLEALGVLRSAIGEVDLMLHALSEQRPPQLPGTLIEALDALYPANVAAAPSPEAGTAAETETATPLATLVPAAAESAARNDTPVVPLTDEIDSQLLPIFLEEAVDLNVAITAELRAWRAAPASDEPVRTLARLLHTLKGSARMAGAMNLGQITHAIETRVEGANLAGPTPLEVIDEIEDAYDAVQHIIERLQRGESVAPAEASEANDGAPAQNVEAAATNEAPAALEAAASSAPFEEFLDARSPVDERRAERRPLAGEAEPATQRAMLRVRADLIDRLVNEAGELSIARARIEGEMRSLKESLLDLTENVIRLRRQLRDIEIQAESQMQSRTARADEQHAGFDPLEFDRFTRFQELTRMMAESVNDVGTVQQNLLKNLDDANAAIIAQARLNREVQQALMAVRMVPFGSLADRLYRLVRRTSKELGKRANLEIRGHQVELDRSVLEKIGAPLEHMLRNAIAHGLEDRALRSERGKPAIGEISLALKQEGNEIVLSLADDGGGLDYEKIRARAIKVGLLKEHEDADAARLAELIFTPGFTTASEVSQVAGRGVGMDVVKTEVTNLGGRIETFSQDGKGTEFRLYIPLTLAVTKALLVRVGTKRYAIPSVMIEQVLDLKEEALAEIRARGAAEWMDNAYPFNYLAHLLGETQALPEKHRQYWTLLLRSGSRRLAVQVDELQGNREIVVKNIGPQLARIIGVDGATVLGDGQVVLILNPIALASRAPLVEFAAPAPSAPRAAAPAHADETVMRVPTVMVVDDSLTVRKITGRLLAREGYDVITAKDGVEALEMLLDVVPDLMLVDIEMPRLDGFDLTRNIRADERLKAIPIIMITSRSATKHRLYAFEIGVNDYLGKPYQEDELLRLVAHYAAQRPVANPA
jgi:chemosensory pili system protein ChpA (sensor histidine kinase/response regulator)